jgi:hypothetical protein
MFILIVFLWHHFSHTRTSIAFKQMIIEMLDLVQCGHILCQDVCLTTSHNSSILVGIPLNVIHAEFVGVCIISNFAHKVRLY